MNLRKAARNRPCQVRLEGCDGGGETTVLAHYRMAGLCGTGMKPDDACAAWACFNCHNIIDGRTKPPSGEFGQALRRLAHAEGVLRTIAALRKEGLL